MIAGAIMSGLGILNAGAAPLCYVVLDKSQESTQHACAGASLVVGGALLAVGIPLLLVGVSRENRFHDFYDRRARDASLSIRETPGGALVTWQIGF